MEQVKTGKGFTAITVDDEFAEKVAADRDAQLANQTGRKKMPLREMVAIYREAWLREQSK